MGLLQILQLIAALAGAYKDVTAVADDLKKRGVQPGQEIPPEHQAKIDAALASVNSAAEDEWDKDHENSGG